MSSAPNGSVTQRQSPRPDLLAFEITDKVTKDDIEWMSANTDEAMKTYDKWPAPMRWPRFEVSASSVA